MNGEFTTCYMHYPKCVIMIVSFNLFFKNKFIYFIYLFLAALGLRCCMQAFSSCGEQGLLFVAVRGLLVVGLLLLWSTGSRHVCFSSCGTWAQ